MQINPTNQADSAFGAFFGAGSSNGSGFLDVMQDAITSVADGDNVSASSALEENQQARVESPYSRHTTDGVTYTLSEVCFTKQELAELRQQLLKEGAPEETLRQFDILAGQPDGATLAQVMASLMANPNTVTLNEDETHAIKALLNQIDPSGTLATDALDLMGRGNGEAAFELIQTALGKMAGDQRIDIDPATLTALGRGLGLNQGTISSMLAALGGNSLSLNAGQFGNLMDPARSQFVTDAANAQKLEAALDKTLKPIISKARERMEKEKEASERESRRVQQSKILIDRTVQKSTRETLDATLAGTSGMEDGAASGMIGHAGAERLDAAQTAAPGQKAAKNAQAKIGQMQDGNEVGLVENAKFALNTQAADKSASGQTGQENGKNKQQDILQDMLNKVETKAAPAASTANNSSIVYSMLQGNAAAAMEKMDAQINLPNPQAQQQWAQQAASQVERGILTAMRDGATRLELQLHPAELGPLAITLISRNGEVTAQLRSEKTETAELLTRQMEMIRVNLEQQGVKVDKIEVQLQNQPDNGQNDFAGLDQHNARQEEETRRQTLNRLRNLAALRNSDESSSLAQGLHNIGQSAELAGSALHVVA